MMSFTRLWTRLRRAVRPANHVPGTLGDPLVISLPHTSGPPAIPQFYQPAYAPVICTCETTRPGERVKIAP